MGTGEAHRKQAFLVPVFFILVMDRLQHKTMLVSLPPAPEGSEEYDPIKPRKYLVLHDQRYLQGDFGRVSIEDNGKRRVAASTNFIAAPPEELRARREAMNASIKPILASRHHRSSQNSLMSASLASFSPYHDGDPMPGALSMTPRSTTFSKPWSPPDMRRTGPTQEHGIETVDPALSPWWLQKERPGLDPGFDRTPTAASRIQSPAVALREFALARQSLATVRSPPVPRDARIVLQAARLTPRFAEEIGTIRARVQTAHAARARTATLAGIF